MVRVRVWVKCEDKTKIEIEGYSDVWVTSMVMVSG